MRILLVEDDPILGMAVRDQLMDDGHTADWVKRLDEAGVAIHAAAFELILLDLMLPDGRGLDFLKRLRSAGDVTPVMVLTALDQISDRIAALDVGADDYLIKPFDLFELSARIRAVGRRYCGNPNPLVAFGDFEVDLAARSIRRGGRLVQLTAREWSLFEAFVQRPNQLISKSQLEERLYSFEAEIQSNTIEVYIGRLRKKLGAEAIETVRGIGYRLGSPGTRA
ncbi:DNA-binding response regulator [Methylocella tundrae]|jgi:two-component system OmpR family response regulator|uniref:DNA-binding response regulator n=1 Tax=Methylocella tundrae TaxID=227605 RepID=A0A4U8Z7Z3_METTU|nr:response regulator transcription factor [Methylocella tundrae]WPP02673.1 response regulator transcription factor [Methylocella tundrae]VFU17749.1 DNA-binding response regulator [Methylocella tundrae]VTZ48864.1 DNA-binding response regulator [Methylocella tundrae]